MNYGTNKEKNTKLGEGMIKMTGKGEPWYTKEEEKDCYFIAQETYYFISLMLKESIWKKFEVAQHY